MYYSPYTVIYYIVDNGFLPIFTELYLRIIDQHNLHVKNIIISYLID